MKNIYTTMLCICFLLNSIVTNAQQNAEKEKLLVRMTNLYSTMLNQAGEGYFIKLDSLLLLEKQLYKNISCISVEYFGFINPSRASEIVNKTPDKNELYKHLLKYQYDTAMTVNNTLYTIHQYLRATNQDTLYMQKVTSRMLDFQVSPRDFLMSFNDISDNVMYYNQEGINKLIRIAGKQYTDKEKAAYVQNIMKCAGAEHSIYYELSSLYQKELYRTEPDKAKREKKLKEITPELVKQHYPELYRHKLDSVAKIYTAEGIQQLYKIDISRFIYVLGKVYAKSSIPVLKEIYRDTLYHNEKERYMASAALARLGVPEYENLFLTDKQPKAGALIYICSQKSIYRFAELMKDTIQKTGCFPWAWEVFGREYKEMKVLLAFKYLWMLDKTRIIQGFSAQFDYNYDDYCLFYTSNTYSKEKEKTLIENAINWLEENKGRYVLNPSAYYYGLNY